MIHNVSSSRRLFAIPFPNIHPVAFSVGPVSIHWYALAYVVGIVIGQQLGHYAKKWVGSDIDMDRLTTAIILGIIIGGRLGYVLFYNPSHYWSNPELILAIWEGGMSFHGGAIGAVLATAYQAKRQGQSIRRTVDILVFCVPPGLFFGRIGNFINGELYGRPTSLPIGVIFPHGGDVARHPSQLYEAGWEGLGLFILLWLILHRGYAPGRLAIAFAVGYGAGRFLIEFTRAPDAQLGLLMGLSMGQWLCIGLIMCGILWNRGRI